MNESLYRLLPTILRARDAEEGEPLRALLGVLEVELDRAGADIQQLYEDAFIETCAPWAIPYIADLLGPEGQPVGPHAPTARRAFVANTIARRRRKGTVAAVEQLAVDLSGWLAAVVELRQRCVVLETPRFPRAQGTGTANLRDAEAASRYGGPFEPHARLLDVRAPSRGGWHGLRHLGVWTYTWQRQELREVEAREVHRSADCRGFVLGALPGNPLLIQRPQAVDASFQLRGIQHVPEPFNNRRVHAELLSQVEGASGPLPIQLSLVTAAQPVGVPLSSSEVCIGTIDDDWPAPPADKALLDLERGRLTLPAGREAEAVLVSAGYAQVAAIGGGAYARDEGLTAQLPVALTWQGGVSATMADGVAVFRTLEEAVEAWRVHASATPYAQGLVLLLDNRSYAMPEAVIPIGRGQRLVVSSGAWPSDGGQRVAGRWSAEGSRAHLKGTLQVRGAEPGSGDAPGGVLGLNGLLIEGDLRITPGDLGALDLRDCTLLRLGDDDAEVGAIEVVAGTGGADQNDSLSVVAARSHLGAVRLHERVPKLELSDCTVDAWEGVAPASGPARTALRAPGAAVWMDAVTLRGEVSCRTLTASNTLFLGRVVAAQRQQGYVRFSYLSPGSWTPRRYRCQPEHSPESQRPAVRPVFRAEGLLTTDARQERFVAVGYLQLSRRAHQALRRGADDGGELGAYHHLQEPAREAALDQHLANYLRVGFSAGVRARSRTL